MVVGRGGGEGGGGERGRQRATTKQYPRPTQCGFTRTPFTWLYMKRKERSSEGDRKFFVLMEAATVAARLGHRAGGWGREGGGGLAGWQAGRLAAGAASAPASPLALPVALPPARRSLT